MNTSMYIDIKVWCLCCKFRDSK